MTGQKQYNPCTRGDEISILEDPSLVIITIYIVCLNHAPEKKIF